MQSSRAGCVGIIFRCVAILLTMTHLSVGKSGSSSADDWHMIPAEKSPPMISCNSTFQPDVISIDEHKSMLVNCSIMCLAEARENNSFLGARFHFQISDKQIAIIEGTSDFNSSFFEHSDTGHWLLSGEASFTIHGVMFGKTVLVLKILPVYVGESDNVTSSPGILSRDVHVTKPKSIINYIFMAVLGVMIVIYNFGFGCKIEWRLIVEIIKKPVAPAIGFCCQFLVMAPLSFGIALLLDLGPEYGMGMLAIGASPGGGGSNVFTFLLKGDLELSITMSFISTLGALGMTPFWIWALARFFTGDNPAIKIPIASVFQSLAVVTIPVIIGLIVNRYKPNVASKVASCLKPFTGVIGIVFMSLGVYTYYPELSRVTWRVVIASLIVPIVGYTIGALVAKIFRQSKSRIITISLETGFQNFVLSLLILETALQKPESDLAGVVPICYTFLSAALPTVVFIVMFIIRIHNGEKPWKKNTEALDLSPLHHASNQDLPAMSDDVFMDSSSRPCVVSAVALDFYTPVTLLDQKPEINGITPMTSLSEANVFKVTYG